MLKKLLLVLLLPLSAAAAPVSFDKCEKLHDAGLAKELMTSIWDKNMRKKFSKQHSDSYKLVREKEATTATIQLKEKVMVAGVAFDKLSASTCEDGCGIQTWQLTTSTVTDADKINLSKWSHKHKVKVDKETGIDFSPTLFQHADKSLSIICDMSN